MVEGFDLGDMQAVLGELVAGLEVVDLVHMRAAGDKAVEDMVAEDMVVGLDKVVEDKVAEDMEVDLDRVVEDRVVDLDKVVEDKEVVLDRVVDLDTVVGDRDKEVGRRAVEDMDLAERVVDLTFILFYIYLYVIINLYIIFFKLISGKFNYNFI